MQSADLTRRLHGRDHLRAGHGRDAQELDLVLGDEREDAFGGVVFKVAVNDLILFLAFKHCGESENSKRKTPVARLGGARMIEDDHAATSATKI
jgi:hypothetical protein